MHRARDPKSPSLELLLTVPIPPTLRHLLRAPPAPILPQFTKAKSNFFANADLPLIRHTNFLPFF